MRSCPPNPLKMVCLGIQLFIFDVIILTSVRYRISGSLGRYVDFRLQKWKDSECWWNSSSARVVITCLTF